MTIDYYKLKRARLRDIRGQETINQVEHIEAAGAKLIMGGVLVPGTVVTADISAAGVLVGGGNLLRIQVSADTYVTFGDQVTGDATDPTLAAVTSSTSPAVKLLSGTVNLVVATGDFVRASANPTRVELIDLP